MINEASALPGNLARGIHFLRATRGAKGGLGGGGGGQSSTGGRVRLTDLHPLIRSRGSCAQVSRARDFSSLCSSRSAGYFRVEGYGREVAGIGVFSGGF